MLKRPSSFQVSYWLMFTHFLPDNFPETKWEMKCFLTDFCINFPGMDLHVTLSRLSTDEFPVHVKWASHSPLWKKKTTLPRFPVHRCSMCSVEESKNRIPWVPPKENWHKTTHHFSICLFAVCQSPQKALHSITDVCSKIRSGKKKTKKPTYNESVQIENKWIYTHTDHYTSQTKMCVISLAMDQWVHTLKHAWTHKLNKPFDQSTLCSIAWVFPNIPTGCA